MTLQRSSLWSVLLSTLDVTSYRKRTIPCVHSINSTFTLQHEEKFLAQHRTHPDINLSVYFSFYSIFIWKFSFSFLPCITQRVNSRFPYRLRNCLFLFSRRCSIIKFLKVLLVRCRSSCCISNASLSNAETPMQCSLHSFLFPKA